MGFNLGFKGLNDISKNVCRYNDNCHLTMALEPAADTLGTVQLNCTVLCLSFNKPG